MGVSGGQRFASEDLPVEWVLAAFLGTAHTSGAPMTIAQPAVGTSVELRNVDYYSNSFDPPFYYGYRISAFRKPGAMIGFEAEMIHLKAYAHTERNAEVSGVHRNETISGQRPINTMLQEFSISHGLNMLLANAVIRRELASASGRPRGHIFGRFGAGPTIPHPESSVDGASFSRYELGALAVQAAAGLELRVARQFGLVAEYKLTRTAQAVAVDRGTAHTTLTSHHGVVGVAWHSQ